MMETSAGWAEVIRLASVKIEEALLEARDVGQCLEGGLYPASDEVALAVAEVVAAAWILRSKVQKMRMEVLL